MFFVDNWLADDGPLSSYVAKRRNRFGMALSLAALGFAASLAACSGTGVTSPSPSGPSLLPNQPLPAAALTAVPTSVAYVPNPGAASQKLSYASMVEAAKPVAYYRMNERSGTEAVDSSGHGHTGTYGGKVALQGPSLLGSDAAARSASFANGYLTENATWSQAAVTAECWIRPSATDLAGTPRILGNAYDDTSGNGFMLFLNNGSPYFYAGFSEIKPALQLHAGSVYYLVGTFDVNQNPSTHFYVDGVDVGSNMYGGNVPRPEHGDSAATVAGAAGSALHVFSNHFSGDISECAIYDRALAASDVAAHHQAGTTAPATPDPRRRPPVRRSSYASTVAGDAPLVYYRMNERSGPYFADSSGNNHPAHMLGAVTLGHAPLLKDGGDATSASFADGYASETVTWSKQAVTAECWIRPTAADLIFTASPRLLGNAWTDNDGKGFMLWLDGGRAKFFAGYSEMIDPGPLEAGDVYHLVGTYDATDTPFTTHFYVNGVMKGQNWTQTPHPESGDSQTTYIGVLDAHPPGPGIVDHFHGDMSDCAVYDRALTPAQVVSHYNVGAQTALAVPTPIPPTPKPTAPPTPGPTGTPVAYDANTACIFGKLYTNNVLPSGEGEFASNGLDRTWWSRYRGDGTATAQLGNWVRGLATSTWGRTQYNTYFGDAADGVSTAADDPFYVGPDTAAPGSPKALRIIAKPMPAHLAGNPAVHGEPYYAGMLFTPVDLTYGFIVARVRTPAPAPGLSPAFWVLQGQGVQAGPHGNLSDEWDIQEMFGNTSGDGMNQGELIWNSSSAGSPAQNWGGSYGQLPGGGKASSDYHDYGVLMNPGGAPISTNYYGTGGPGLTYGDPSTGGTFFFDGRPVYGHTGGADINTTATRPGYKEIMAMFQVSTGGWLGSPSASEFPSAYWLQWIRVYRPTGGGCS